MQLRMGWFAVNGEASQRPYFTTPCNLTYSKLAFYRHLLGFLPLNFHHSVMDVCRGVVYVWVCLACLNAVKEVTCGRQESICGTYNGRRLYLELGDKGILYSGNATIHQKSNQRDIKVHDQCSIEIVTCPACVIKVSFLHMNLSPQCGNSAGGMGEHQCRCDYLWLSEPPYEEVSGASYCGFFQSTTINALNYRSLTRSLSLTFLFTESHSNAFVLEFTAERNRLHFSGSPRISNIPQSISPGGEITSPFFPAQYPRDLSSEYTIHCDVQIGVRCRIRLLFLDYQLATVSIMKFYNLDNERQHIDSSSGASFRPPVILSSGPTLLIRFNANGGTGLGFKILYSFVTGTFDLTAIKPITYCGGHVENLGGAITMMNMVEPGKSVKKYDCIWVIKPLTNYFHLKTHIYLKVVTFSNMADAAEIIVRKGVTSDGPIIESARFNSFQGKNSPSKVEHIVPLNVGFYVTLHGAFSASSRVAIVYSAFSFVDEFASTFPSHRDCFSGSDFLCQNHRCISGHLSCDGFDHCGDNSDEPSECYHEWGSDLLDRRWYAKIPNYYFPKIEPYPDLKTATLVFIVGTFGLMMLIVTLIVLLYRMGSRGNQQRELQNHLQTISDLLAAESRPEETPPDEPPVYEAPPDYDEIIKLTPTLVPASTPRHPHRRKRQLANFPSKPSFSANLESTLDPMNTKLSVALPPVQEGGQRRQSLPGSMLSASTDALLGSIPSCPSTPAHTLTSVPDSPPPPYVESPFLVRKTGAENQDIFLDFPSEGPSVVNGSPLPVTLSNADVAPRNSMTIQMHFPVENPSIQDMWGDPQSASTSQPWTIEPADVFFTQWADASVMSRLSDSWVQFKSSESSLPGLQTPERRSPDIRLSEVLTDEFRESPDIECINISDKLDTYSWGSSSLNSHDITMPTVSPDPSNDFNDKLKYFDLLVSKYNVAPRGSLRQVGRRRMRSLDMRLFSKREICSLCHNASCTENSSVRSKSNMAALSTYLTRLDVGPTKLKSNSSSVKVCDKCQMKASKKLCLSIGSSLDDLNSLV
nr:PREDICTED: uncharacterized protein LOC109041304 isoform X1 [Bemisia tabaci]